MRSTVLFVALVGLASAQAADNTQTNGNDPGTGTARVGSVTLRGPVRTPSEKNLIGKLAADGGGVAKVRNKLEVVPEDRPMK